MHDSLTLTVTMRPEHEGVFTVRAMELLIEPTGLTVDAFISLP